MKTVGVLVIAVIAALILFFNCYYSKLQCQYEAGVKQLRSSDENEQEVLTQSEICQLPQVLQRFYEYAGYIGKSNSHTIELYCEKADFAMNHGDKMMHINYTEDVFTSVDRLAFIDAKMYGIPFQGLDECIKGKGSMTGVLGKCIQLFCVKGKEMDEAALSTWICEAVLLPKAMLRQDIIWKQESDNKVTAEITINQMTVSATYTFDDQGRLVMAQTDNRWLTEKDGTFTNLPWCVVFEDYQEAEGRCLPRCISTKWQHPDGEDTYFKCENAQIKFE